MGACVSRSCILVYNSLVEIDRELTDALQQILELCREFDVHPRLIGGLAVRGFARRKRFTHDIDLAISRNDKPNFIMVLKRLGFEYQDLSKFEGVKITAQLAKLENALRSGDFREAWSEFYGTPLSARDVLTVIEKVRSLQKAKP